MEKTDICYGNRVGLAVNVERNSVAPRESDLTRFKAQEPQCPNNEVVGYTFLGGCGGDGEFEVVEVFLGGLRKGRTLVIRRRVENGRVDVVERGIRGSEKIVWLEGFDGDVVRVKPVISRACEALYGVEFKKRRFVSKRIAFFGNVVCLPNFRESVSLYWPREFVPTRFQKLRIRSASDH